MTTLSAEQIGQYERDGYTVVEDVVDKGLLDDLLAVVDEFVERSRSVTESDSVFDLEPGHTAERPLLRRIKFPAHQHPLFHEVMVSDALLDCVADLIGPDIRYQGCKLNMKLGEIGSPVEWHQDFAFFPHSNDDLVTCALALDDSDEENGNLLVIPRSHKGAILDHHDATGRHIGAVEPDLPEVAGSTPVAVPLRAGSMSMHHTRLLHASAPNKSQRPRRLLLYGYAAADAAPLSAVPRTLDEWDKRMLRGTSTRVARSVDLPPFRLPNFVGDAGSIYALQTQLGKSAFRS